MTLEAVDGAGLSPILDYIYGGTFEINAENMMDVIEAASYLQIACVIKMCARYLYETLTIENLVQYSQLIERYGLDCLILEQRSVVECIAIFAREHFTEIYDHIGFSNLSYDVLKRVMSCNDLTCPELTVYNIILEWIRANPSQGEQRKSNLLDCIHFLCMSEKMLLDLKVSIEAVDNSYLSEKIDRALHYLDPNTSLAERLEIGTPEKLIRGPTSVIVIGGPPTNPVEDSISDAVQVLMFHEDFSPAEGCWGWGHNGNIRPPYTSSNVASMDGMMFICGGHERSDREEPLRIAKNCYIFDPVLWQLKEIANMNVPRSSFALVECDGYLYAIGGVCNYPEPLDVCQTIERYCLHENCWTTVGYLPKPVFSQAATSTGHLIYVYGGIDRFHGPEESFFSFDPLTEEFKTFPIPEFCRAGCTLLTADHRILLARPDNPELWVFDTNTEQWSEMELLGNDFHEPAAGSIGVVNTVPVLSKEPILFFIGGHIHDEIEGIQEASNIFVPIFSSHDQEKIQGQIFPLPDMKYNVTQPLVVTVPIPSFRLEAFRHEIVEEQKEYY